MTGWYDVKSSKMLSIDSGSRGPWPDLPSPLGRKCQFCFHTPSVNSYTEDGVPEAA